MMTFSAWPHSSSKWSPSPRTFPQSTAINGWINLFKNFTPSTSPMKPHSTNLLKGSPKSSQIWPVFRISTVDSFSQMVKHIASCPFKSLGIWSTLLSWLRKCKLSKFQISALHLNVHKDLPTMDAPTSTFARVLKRGSHELRRVKARKNWERWWEAIWTWRKTNPSPDLWVTFTNLRMALNYIQMKRIPFELMTTSLGRSADMMKANQALCKSFAVKSDCWLKPMNYVFCQNNVLNKTRGQLLMNIYPSHSYHDIRLPYLSFGCVSKAASKVFICLKFSFWLSPRFYWSVVGMSRCSSILFATNKIEQLTLFQD